MNSFDILGITKLNSKTLKKAYKEKSKIYHPDNKKTGDEDMFIKINSAYETLKKLIVKTYIVKVNIEDMIDGVCEYKICNRCFKIKIDNFKNFMKPYNFDYNGQKYRVIFKFVSNEGYKVYKKKKKYYIEKLLDINLTDIINGDVRLILNTRLYVFKIPRKGILEDTINLSGDIYFKLCYNIVV